MALVRRQLPERPRWRGSHRAIGDNKGCLTGSTLRWGKVHLHHARAIRWQVCGGLEVQDVREVTRGGPTERDIGHRQRRGAAIRDGHALHRTGGVHPDTPEVYRVGAQTQKRSGCGRSPGHGNAARTTDLVVREHQIRAQRPEIIRCGRKRHTDNAIAARVRSEPWQPSETIVKSAALDPVIETLSTVAGTVVPFK